MSLCLACAACQTCRMCTMLPEGQSLVGSDKGEVPPHKVSKHKAADHTEGLACPCRAWKSLFLSASYNCFWSLFLPALVHVSKGLLYDGNEKCDQALQFPMQPCISGPTCHQEAPALCIRQARLACYIHIIECTGQCPPNRRLQMGAWLPLLA